jgi:hypothetical protein
MDDLCDIGGMLEPFHDLLQSWFPITDEYLDRMRNRKDLSGDPYFAIASMIDEFRRKMIDSAKDHAPEYTEQRRIEGRVAAYIDTLPKVAEGVS